MDLELGEEHDMTMQVDVTDQIDRVVVKLRVRYVPLCGEAAVDAAIADAISYFATATVRDHLPILIERRARAALDAGT
jgi:hypothetical protein